MPNIWDSKNKFAVIVGIEDYRPSKATLPKVAYARKDAEDFKKLLLEHFHFEEKEITLWVNEHASKIALENELAYQIKSLPPDTSFVFYYAGHGFSKNGQNLLTCWDTFAGNVEETSVSLRERLLDPLIKAGCQRSLVFLDACAKDVAIGRTVLTGIEAEEFRAFTAEHPFHAQFMACSAGEASYPSAQLGNGIWTWHLLKALSGGVPAIISPDRTITDHALRDYLADAVPNYITHKTTINGTQTPWANINTSKTFAIQFIPAPAVPSGQLTLSSSSCTSARAAAKRVLSCAITF